MSSNSRNSFLRLYIITCLIVLQSAAATHARPNDNYHVKPSRNLSRQPLPSRAEYLKLFPERELALYDVTHFNAEGIFRRDDNMGIALAVNPRLHEIHHDAIEVWVADLTGEGWDVDVIDIEGGSAQELKTALLETAGDGLAGIIFLGEFPLAWFEQYEYFDDQPEPDNDILAEYPVDLFFADMNGVWSDNDSNGIYDAHSGNWQPELWIGRIAAYNLSRLDEDTLVADYLDRIHRYRLGELHLPHQALSFTDDDWINSAEEWKEDAELAFGRVVLIDDSEATNASAYKAELNGEGYELIQVAAHSNADTHTFWINQHHDLDYFRFRHLRDEVTPHAFFYNLFACSAMNLAGNLCMGALYPLKGPYSLAAVGSSKTGGMLYFDDFYKPLGEQIPVGESLRQWFVLHGREEGHELWAQSWFYGMTCFGDPTLKIIKGLSAGNLSVIDNDGDGDMRADAGEIINLTITCHNLGQFDQSNVEAILVSLDTLVVIEDSVRNYGDILGGAGEAEQNWPVNLSPFTPNDHIAHLELQLTSGSGETWWVPIQLRIFAPSIAATQVEFISENENHGFAGPGESGKVIFSILNRGGDNSHGELSHLISLDELIQIHVPIDSVGEIRSDGHVFAMFDYDVSIQASMTDMPLLELQATQGDVLLGQQVLCAPISSSSRFNANLDQTPNWMRHSSVKEGYHDVWRWDANEGENSGGFELGGLDTSYYPAMCDAVLELPAISLAAGGSLIIKHKLNAEELYDAATVELNHGDGWVRANPLAGYNGQGADNGSFAGGPCWNGSFDWRTDEIPLGEENGLVRARLRFSSDQGVENTGWRIDRLEYSGTLLKLAQEQPLPSMPTVVNAFPNPFNSTLSIQISGETPTQMALYDLQGRKVHDVSIPLLLSNSELISLNEFGLPAGIYYLKWESHHSNGSTKLALLK